MLTSRTSLLLPSPNPLGTGARTGSAASTESWRSDQPQYSTSNTTASHPGRWAQQHLPQHLKHRSNDPLVAGVAPLLGGYVFMRPALLHEARTHCSFPQPPCNQVGHIHWSMCDGVGGVQISGFAEESANCSCSCARLVQGSTCLINLVSLLPDDFLTSRSAYESVLQHNTA